jgi:hypothetical protein
MGQILLEAHKKVRARTIEVIIKVGLASIAICNFFMLGACVVALRSPHCGAMRLQRSWKQLRRPTQDRWAELCDFCDCRLYTAQRNAARDGVACVPYFGAILLELQRIRELNSQMRVSMGERISPPPLSMPDINSSTNSSVYSSSNSSTGIYNSTNSSTGIYNRSAFTVNKWRSTTVSKGESPGGVVRLTEEIPHVAAHSMAASFAEEVIGTGIRKVSGKPDGHRASAGVKLSPLALQKCVSSDSVDDPELAQLEPAAAAAAQAAALEEEMALSIDGYYLSIPWPVLCKMMARNYDVVFPGTTSRLCC